MSAKGLTLEAWHTPRRANPRAVAALRPCPREQGVFDERVERTALVEEAVASDAEHAMMPERREESVPPDRWSAQSSIEADIGIRFRELVLPHLDGAYNLARYLMRDPVLA